MTEEQKCPVDFASPRLATVSTSPSVAITNSPSFPPTSIGNTFLDLVEQHSEERDVRVAAYTLMSNHFHLVAVGIRAIHVYP